MSRKHSICIEFLAVPLVVGPMPAVDLSMSSSSPRRSLPEPLVLRALRLANMLARQRIERRSGRDIEPHRAALVEPRVFAVAQSSSAVVRRRGLLPRELFLEASMVAIEIHESESEATTCHSRGARQLHDWSPHRARRSPHGETVGVISRSSPPPTIFCAASSRSSALMTLRPGLGEDLLAELDIGAFEADDQRHAAGRPP